MSELDLACQRLKLAINNQAKTVDMARKWHDMALRGSTQTQKLRKLCNAQRKA